MTLDGKLFCFIVTDIISQLYEVLQIWVLKCRNNIVHILDDNFHCSSKLKGFGKENERKDRKR
jgi:hypothetical protein